MAARFCSQCGAELVAQARFCIGCGRALAGGIGRWRVPVHLRRSAPILIFGVVLAAGVVGVVAGRLAERPPPSVPGRSLPGGANASASLPEGHPPIEVPENVRQMMAAIRREAEAAPDDAEKWKRLAGVEYRASKIDPRYAETAERAYMHVVGLDPKDREALRNLGNLAYDRDDHARAIEYYERYMALEPDDLEARTDLGTMYLGKGDTAKAIDVYGQVLRRAPEFYQALFNLGVAYRRRGDFDAAVASFRKARQAAPEGRAGGRGGEASARSAGTPARGGGAAGTAAAAAGKPFRQAVEDIFGKHPMMGAKVDGFEWQGETSLQVQLQQFPVAQMPPEIRQRFVGAIRTELRKAKASHGIRHRVAVALVDGESKTVMETIAE